LKNLEDRPGPIGKMFDLYDEWWDEYWGCGETIYYGDKGFITYQEEKESLFVFHFFVKKAWRNKDIGICLFNAVAEQAKTMGKKSLTCGVNLKMKGSTGRLSMFFAHGFKVKSNDDTFVYLENILAEYTPKLRVVE